MSAAPITPGTPDAEREEREAADFLAAHANDYASLCDAE